jgi:quercetin dioxygenase-like cupin family protein
MLGIVLGEKGEQEMLVVQAKTAQETPNPHGVQAQSLHTTEHVQVTMITLQPGQALKLHTTPVDATFYGLEGEGIVEIGDERATMTADTLVHSPKGIPHRLLNQGAEAFRFLVIKTPARPPQD